MSNDGTDTAVDRGRFRGGFLLLLVAGITAIFYAMLKSFLTALLLGAIFSGLTYPLYRWLTRCFRGRPTLAALATIALFVLVLLIPLAGFTGLVASQAVELTQAVTPWVQERLSEPDQLESVIAEYPFLERLTPYTDQILAKVGAVIGQIGDFVLSHLASVTGAAITFVFMIFVMLYAMYFFLKDGPIVIERILYYMPLSREDEQLLLDKFVSVARATIKGSVLIGILQGALAGISFALVGLPASALWGMIMVVLSILPGVGAALVWIPAVIYLLIVGDVAAGVGVSLWCGLVVGSIDNLLRPRLIGHDAKLPDLLILLGTLGGVVLFGMAGVIIGPIVTALFLTVWELYGTAFRDFLVEKTANGQTSEPQAPAMATEGVGADGAAADE